jgi:hypothetical protein
MRECTQAQAKGDARGGSQQAQAFRGLAGYVDVQLRAA